METTSESENASSGDQQAPAKEIDAVDALIIEVDKAIAQTTNQLESVSKDCPLLEQFSNPTVLVLLNNLRRHLFVLGEIREVVNVDRNFLDDDDIRSIRSALILGDGKLDDFGISKTLELLRKEEFLEKENSARLLASEKPPHRLTRMGKAAQAFDAVLTTWRSGEYKEVDRIAITQVPLHECETTAERIGSRLLELAINLKNEIDSKERMSADEEVEDILMELGELSSVMPDDEPLATSRIFAVQEDVDDKIVSALKHAFYLSDHKSLQASLSAEGIF